jgi:hypothetical protein
MREPKRRNLGSVARFCNERRSQAARSTVRICVIGAVMISLGVGEAWAQTAAPPAAAPAPAAPAAPAAPSSGAPALSPTPSTPNPTGVAVPPTPSVNSTPSQSNVDLHPPSRLTNPGAPAGPPAQGQVDPATPHQGQAAQGSGRPQAGGANTSAAGRKPKKTGNDYSVAECMNLWDAKTHMTQGQWRAACARVQSRLNNLEATAEATGTKKAPTSGRAN